MFHFPGGSINVNFGFYMLVCVIIARVILQPAFIYTYKFTVSIASKNRNKLIIQLTEWIPHTTLLLLLLLCGQRAFGMSSSWAGARTLLIHAAQIPPAGIINEVFSYGTKKLLLRVVKNQEESADTNWLLGWHFANFTSRFFWKQKLTRILPF